jgi:hypothetical protein
MGPASQIPFSALSGHSVRLRNRCDPENGQNSLKTTVL